MHELSIATNIVEIAEEEVKRNNGKLVSEMILEIGELSGVVYDALEFAMKEAVKESCLKKSEIKIERIKGIAKCISCNHEFETEDYFNICPNCVSSDIEIFKGKELKVKSIKIEY